MADRDPCPHCTRISIMQGVYLSNKSKFASQQIGEVSLKLGTLFKTWGRTQEICHLLPNLCTLTWAQIGFFYGANMDTKEGIYLFHFLSYSWRDHLPYLRNIPNLYKSEASRYHHSSLWGAQWIRLFSRAAGTK